MHQRRIRLKNIAGYGLLIFRSCFTFLSGMLMVSLLLFSALRYLVDHSDFDPFLISGAMKPIFDTPTNIAILLGGPLGIIIDLILWKRLRSRVGRTVYHLLLLPNMVFALLGYAPVRANHFNFMENEKRRQKVLTTYGKQEDMCEVLKPGMSRDEVVAIMGKPEQDKADASSYNYCPHNNPCRFVDFDEAGQVQSVECWREGESLPAAKANTGE